MFLCYNRHNKEQFRGILIQDEIVLEVFRIRARVNHRDGHGQRRNHRPGGTTGADTTTERGASFMEDENEVTPRLCYTPEEAAKILHVSHWTVRRWASAGKLPSVHVGRRLLFTVEAVNEALKTGIK